MVPENVLCMYVYVYVVLLYQNSAQKVKNQGILETFLGGPTQKKFFAAFGGPPPPRPPTRAHV